MHSLHGWSISEDATMLYILFSVCGQFNKKWELACQISPWNFTAKLNLIKDIENKNC